MDEKVEDCELGLMLTHGKGRLSDDKEGNWNTGNFLLGSCHYFRVIEYFSNIKVGHVSMYRSVDVMMI